MGEALTRALVDRGQAAEFVDADGLHPQANKDKMHAGIPPDRRGPAPLARRLLGTHRRGAAVGLPVRHGELGVEARLPRPPARGRPGPVHRVPRRLA
ncbi:hypothetical protein [Curtobacterium sp. MCPF17_052]|uniref:hypothetical protein n=1 Tax=Curtobacterium sp. MCPF17_052 TaxID=2175655 RepID=UPI0024DFCFE9|nr:hypothetical protein [Curtobacterium sp. MCPF17_052]WIB11975.1 hypothetical protein DEJ36_14150 [Curtobacterium sp. MCPF17_052]